MQRLADTQTCMANKRIDPKYLLLGKILRPHGVKGELRTQILTDYPERLQADDTVYLGHDPTQNQATAYTVQSTRFHKDYLLLLFKEIQGRNEADLLRGQYVMIDFDHAVPLADDEFYLYEIIGLTVQLQDGTPLGTIQDVLETGANDVLVVEGSRRYLIPVVFGHYILNIDLDGGQIRVDWDPEYS